MSPESLSRREVFLRGGLIAAGLSVADPLAVALAEEPGAAPESNGRPGVRLTEGTNFSVALSPDGTTLAMDLVTGIWLLPAAGGEARRLTDDLQDATLPNWSPDGKALVFQSYRDGNYHLYSLDVAGGQPRQLTSGPYDHREPAFSPDGKRIALSSDRGGSYGIWLLDPATGQLQALTDTAAEESAPRWSRDGQRVLFTVDDLAIDAITVASGERKTLLTAPAGGKIYGPAFGPDDQTPGYLLLRGATADLMLGDQQVTQGEDVFGFAATWTDSGVLYTGDGRIRRRTAESTVDIPFSAVVPIKRRDYRHRVRDLDSLAPQPVRGIAGPVVSPDGKTIAFRALNALYLVPAGGGKPQRLTSDQYFSSDPDFSPDGKKLVYASDRLGTADLWVRDLASGEDTVLTALPGAQVAPRWSPDGGKIAYTDQDGALWTLDVASKEVRQLTPALFMPGRPSWSGDGSTIALAAVKPFSKRFREGTSQILTVPAGGGELTYTEPMPFRSLATRGDDGPLFSPDGKRMAFTVESTAWVVPVDGKGAFLGEPRQVTREVTDSLAWLDDGTLVYLCKGELRRVAVDGGKPRTIRLDFSWRRPKPAERTVIHVGGLWDGTAEKLRENVDVVVENGRIKEIRPHQGTADVDASGLTAIPGLIDAHNHWHLRGRHWGDRQGRLWLSYGITTTRSPGDPVYQMIETREALESGARLGPRFFGTGEAIDGSRVYYNFMRPTLSPEQLKLELDRAVSLGYDLIKTYVRLPVRLQRETVEAAHRAGIPLSSHYLFPAANLGMDGMEHVGATNRLGYSHTISRTGWTYQDSIELFVRSGMSITPTLFNSKALYADDKSLVEDERTKVLFPQWEYDRLVTDAENAGKPENAYVRDVLAGNVDMVLRVHRAGGFVISGTDTPLDSIAISLHQNLRAMVEFGFTPYEALVTATRNPARRLGLAGRLGELRPGAYADLSLVEGNPLADIRAAAAVRQVFVGGVAHRVDDLLAPFRSPGSASIVNPVLPANTTAAHWWHRPEWSEHVCCGI
ncbi:amidohydrolase family protein [Amycolatopsis sp. 195334CR]|uniref:amidohydrolase family protein n=1 Tax=Amycolatopsis sp. 195334CR TaxID=2814588 RepID=UPI001A8CABF0|nr:amidohydrolase family protein [Amycolatopsis sp. 195334CR]MBN6036842.1 PD40 domain-containing protein [Amycolatopsis sp. 195334CR]